MSLQTRLISGVAGRIHRKRQRKSKELVQDQKAHQCCAHRLDVYHEPFGELDVHAWNRTDRRGFAYDIEYRHWCYNGLCRLLRPWPISPGALLRDIWQKTSLHNLLFGLQHSTDSHRVKPEYRSSDHYPNYLGLFREYICLPNGIVMQYRLTICRCWHCEWRWYNQ